MSADPLKVGDRVTVMVRGVPARAVVAILLLNAFKCAEARALYYRPRVDNVFYALDEEGITWHRGWMAFDAAQTRDMLVVAALGKERIVTLDDNEALYASGEISRDEWERNVELRDIRWYNNTKR